MPITKINPQLYGADGAPISFSTSNAESPMGAVEIAIGDEAMDQWIENIKRLNQDRRAGYIYHAYGNPRFSWTDDAPACILGYASVHQLRTAVWENPESAIQLVVVQDPDTSENSGLDLYHSMKAPTKKYQSYGLAHYTEWEHYGFELDISDPIIGGADGKYELRGVDGKSIYLY